MRLNNKIYVPVFITLLVMVSLSYASTFITNDQSTFNEGTYNWTFYNATGGYAQLNASNTSGNYTSKIFNAGSLAHWNNISWTQETLYGLELPNNQQVETGLGGANMTGNVLLMHMNESSGNIIDYSGNGNNGTYNGALYNQTGKLNNAIGFNGSNVYINVADSSSINITGNLTVTAWIKTNSSTTQDIFKKVSTFNGTNTGGTASASSSYSGNPPADAFDDDYVTKGWGNNNLMPSWLQYDFGAGNEKVVTKYGFIMNSAQVGGWGSNSYNPKTWTFNGYNETGGTWVQLDSQDNGTLVMNTWYEFPINNTFAYRRYSINVSAAQSGTWLHITEVQLQYYDNGYAGQADSGVFKYYTLKNSSISVAGTRRISDNSWHLVSLVFNGTHSISYIDGTADNISVSAGIGAAGVPLKIGGNNSFFNGTIDEIAIWNRTLSAAEILNIYKRGALRLNLSVRSCNDFSCSSSSWTNLGNNLTSPQNLSVTNNTYFQYKYDFSTDNASSTPALYNVTVDYTLLDVTPPNITLNLPSNGLNTSNQNLTFNFTAIEDYPGNINCSLYIDNVFQSGNSSVANNTLTNLNASGIAGGLHYWNITCKDLANNANTSETRSFYVDLIPPSISIVYPINTTYSINVSTLNYTVSDVRGLDSCWYSLNNGVTNSTLVTCGTNWTGLTSNEGSNTWTVYANDSSGNLNSSSITFFKDTIVPLINYSNETAANYVNLSQNFIFINTSWTEINFANITFNLYNLTSQVNVTTFTNPTYSINFTNLSDKTYTYYVNITDIAGNKNSTPVYTITLDTHNPNATLLAPADDSYNSTNIQNFTTNLTDNLGLKNATLNIWNSTSQVNQTTFTFASNTSTIGAVVTLVDNVYKWWYQVWDWAGNTFTTQNNTVTIDTIKPTINFTSPTPSNNTWYNVNTQTINITGSDVNYNYSLISLNNANYSMSCSGKQPYYCNYTFNNLADGTYNITAYSFDLAGNMNQTEKRTFYIDTVPPSISNIVYSPNSTDDVDPGVNLTFNATVVDDRVQVSSVILQYYDGTAWNNKTMSEIGTSNVYTANITTVSTEQNYTFNIWANDTLGNSNQTTNQTFSSSWDCSWTATSDLGQTAGWNENKWIGNITINNTGDPQYSNNNCSLDFRLTYDLTEGRIYIDNIYYKPKFYYGISAKSNQSISVNATFLSEVKEESAKITINEISSRSSTTNRNVTATLFSTTGGPYLYQKLVSAPSSLYLTVQNSSLSAYLRNVVGDGTLNKTAYNVSFNWTLPSSFLVKDGNDSLFYDNITNNSLFYNNLNLTFNSSNLPDLSPGTFTIYLYAWGYNSSGSLITHAGNRTLLTEQANISLLCSSTSDGVCVSACGYLLDSDCKQPTIETTTGGGGGGGGSAISSGMSIEQKSRLFQTSELFELVRGKDQSFVITVANPFTDGILQDVSLDVKGFLSQYISLVPMSVSQIPVSFNFTVDIIAPKYFTKGKYNLTFTIKGITNRTLGNTTIITRMTEKRDVFLEVHELSRVDASNLLNQSLLMLNSMKDKGFYTKDVEDLVEQSQTAFDLRDYEAVQDNYNKIKEMSDSAFSADNSLSQLTGLLVAAKDMEVKADQTSRLYNLIKAAFDRGDFSAALERSKEAMLTYAIETKGAFNIFYFLKKNWIILSIVVIISSISLVLIFFRTKLAIISHKLSNLRNEEKILLGLMKVVQSECFDKGKMSMNEYYEAMGQYEDRFNKAVQETIRLETIRANFFKFGSKEKRLIEEKKRLLELIKDVQRDYMEKGKIETRVYENKMKSYSDRFAEIEEQLALLEAERALKKVK